MIDPTGVYFRPEGRELMLVGLEIGSEVGGSPDQPEGSVSAAHIELSAARVCLRVPWMTLGTYRTGHSGQDGITPQLPDLGDG